MSLRLSPLTLDPPPRHQVRIHRSSFLRLRVTRKGDPFEATFLTQLVEDRSPAGMSYVEYLCQMHRLIQLKLA